MIPLILFCSIASCGCFAAAYLLTKEENKRLQDDVQDQKFHSMCIRAALAREIKAHLDTKDELAKYVRKRGKGGRFIG
jgi:hypothetical protein